MKYRLILSTLFLMGIIGYIYGDTNAPSSTSPQQENAVTQDDSDQAMNDSTPQPDLSDQPNQTPNQPKSMPPKKPNSQNMDQQMDQGMNNDNGGMNSDNGMGGAGMDQDMGNEGNNSDDTGNEDSSY